MKHVYELSDLSVDHPVSGSFNPYPQWILLVGALLLVGAILMAHFYTAQARIWASERERLGNQSKAMRHNIEYQLTAVHNVLMDIRENLAPHVLSLESGKGMQDLSRQSLMSKLNIMPGVRTLGILDRDGTMVASSLEFIVGNNFQDRDYFLAPLTDLNIETMYVVPPFKVRGGEVWTIALSCVVQDSTGEFQGVVFAALDKSFFAALLSSMNYAPDMWAAIAHGNGRQFMMAPNREGMSGLDLARPGSFFMRHQESGNRANIMTGQVLATGDERIMALQTINPSELKLDWPLVLGTGRSLDAVFAMWKRDLELVLLFYSLVTLASVLLLSFYQRRLRAQTALSNALSASLLSKRRRLAGILEATNVGTWEWHVKSGGVVFNGRWAEIVGYTLDELQPVSIETWVKLTHPDDLVRSDQLLQRHFNSELEYYECEARMLHKSGRWVWVLGRGRVMQCDSDGAPIVMMGTHTDITDKKQAELRLQVSAESLERYNHELEQFASVVSHDLRQPIGMVSSYLELLRLRYGAQLKGEANDMIAAAERGARRLDGMLQGLLEYARVSLDEQHNDKKVIRLLDVITDVRELLSSEIEQSHARIICPPVMGAVTMRACQYDLVRLFMNLISNAIKYRRPDVHPVIELDVMCAETGWRFTITDNGLGFDPSQSVRLFRMFQRLHLHAEYPGSGIGLVLCKKIVERYQGEIEIESSGAGTGATVRFTLQDAPGKSMACT